MPALEEIALQIAQLSALDREILLSQFAEEAGSVSTTLKELTPGIVTTPDVCGGVPRIIRTRIPVWTLERMRQLGIHEAEILRSFPTLRAIDLVQAWRYAESHREEIREQIRENEED